MPSFLLALITVFPIDIGSCDTRCLDIHNPNFGNFSISARSRVFFVNHQADLKVAPFVSSDTMTKNLSSLE